MTRNIMPYLAAGHNNLHVRLLQTFGLCFLFSCCNLYAASPATQNLPVVTFPIEVLGMGLPSQPTIKGIELGLDADELKNISYVQVICHRCGFHSSPEFEKTAESPAKIKASMRIIGGGSKANIPWVDVTEKNVLLSTTDALQGGFNSSVYTLQFALALNPETKSRLVPLPKTNRIEFRFNGTEGSSNGFRILNVSFFDKNNRDLTKVNRISENIRQEKDAGKVYSTDVDKGRALWYGQNLLRKSSIVPRTIHSSCSSCHASDGRDLQYFNYSNNSIVQRSLFHGLTQQQGSQLAAFIRYSQQNLPYVAQAKPWNPPYQPTHGMDCNQPGCKPVFEWAAGGGLDVILASPKDSMRYLLGKPIDQITQADLDALMDPNNTFNAKETRIALQLPDWNSWLPQTHPMDLWPDGGSVGSFNGGANVSGGRYDPVGIYKKAEDWLEAHKNPNKKYGDWSHLTPDERTDIQNIFNRLGEETIRFEGGGESNHTSADHSKPTGADIAAQNMRKLVSTQTTSLYPSSSFSYASFIERATSSVMHWNSIKQWELAHKYGLEGNQRWFMGKKDPATGQWIGRGEGRGWPFNTFSVFDLAPHRLYQSDSQENDRTFFLAWERDNVIGSIYNTNQWYYLQMILNAGGQGKYSNNPIDWPYLTAFIRLFGEKLGASTPAKASLKLDHYVRMIGVMAKAGQYVNNDIPLNAPNPSIPNDIFRNQGWYSKAEPMKGTLTWVLDNTGYQGAKTPYHGLDDIAPGLYLKLVNSTLFQFNSLYANTKPAEWRRCDPNLLVKGMMSEPHSGARFCLDQSRSALPVNAKGEYYYVPNGGAGNLSQSTTQQLVAFSVLKSREIGADTRRVNTMTNWMNLMWPY